MKVLFFLVFLMPLLLLNFVCQQSASGQSLVRIGDIVSVEGQRSNDLNGIGLVVGLDGTGGRSGATSQAAANLFRKGQINFVPRETTSLSLVMVTAELPPNVKPGEKIRCTVSVADGATSLQGGTLIRAPLKGADDNVYAVASGDLIVGGFSASGQGASVKKHIATKAVCEAVVEKVVCQTTISFDGTFRLLLQNKSYEFARRIKNEINKKFPNVARVVDHGTVSVQIPRNWMRFANEYIAEVHNLKVQPAAPATIVINESSGTVVIGRGVKISASLIAMENLIVSTAENPQVSQPNPLSDGQTVVVPRTQVDVHQQSGNFRQIGGEITINELAKTLNSLGFTPRDLIQILHDIKAAGGLQAKLKIQ